MVVTPQLVSPPSSTHPPRAPKPTRPPRASTPRIRTDPNPIPPRNAQNNTLRGPTRPPPCIERQGCFRRPGPSTAVHPSSRPRAPRHTNTAPQPPVHGSAPPSRPPRRRRTPCTYVHHDQPRQKAPKIHRFPPPPLPSLISYVNAYRLTTIDQRRRMSYVSTCDIGIDINTSASVSQV